MVDITDDAKGGGYRRVEVLTGPGRRRRWSSDDKARIVSETLQPGAMVADVARRWQICPQQVFTWRRAMRGEAAAPLSFVPIVGDAPAMVLERPVSPSIEVELSGAVLRVVPGTDADLLTTVLRAVRVSAV